MKITEDDIDIIDIGELRHVRFSSLEGDEIEWTDEQAHKLKQQILTNQQLRDEIVDLADIWDGVESMRYGRALLNVLDKLGIKDVPAFYSKENINKMIKELDEKRNKK